MLIGYKRKRFYLSNIVKVYEPLFIFLQETWLSDYEAKTIANDFKDYNFITTSADMFEHAEDLVLKSVQYGMGLPWDGRNQLIRILLSFP